MIIFYHLFGIKEDAILQVLIISVIICWSENLRLRVIFSENAIAFSQAPSLDIGEY